MRAGCGRLTGTYLYLEDEGEGRLDGIAQLGNGGRECEGFQLAVEGDGSLTIRLMIVM